MKYLKVTFLFLILVLLGSPAISQEAKLFKRGVFYNSMKFTYVGLQAADLITTYRGISLGAIETNRLMSDLVHNHPAVLVLVKTSITVGALYLFDKAYDENKLLTTGLLAGLNIVVGIVVANNVSLIIKLK